MYDDNSCNNCLHFLFVCWGIVNIFRSKMEEVREASSKQKHNDRNNVAKTALRDVPKTKDSAIEISVINPLFQAKGATKGKRRLNTRRSSTCGFKCILNISFFY